MRVKIYFSAGDGSGELLRICVRKRCRAALVTAVQDAGAFAGVLGMVGVFGVLVRVGSVD